MLPTYSQVIAVGSYAFVATDVPFKSVHLLGRIIEVSGARVYYATLFKASFSNVYLNLPRTVPYDTSMARYVKESSIVFTVSTFEEALFIANQNDRMFADFCALQEAYGVAALSGFTTPVEAALFTPLTYDQFLPIFEEMSPFIDKIVAEDSLFSDIHGYISNNSLSSLGLDIPEQLLAKLNA